MHPLTALRGVVVSWRRLARLSGVVTAGSAARSRALCSASVRTSQPALWRALHNTLGLTLKWMSGYSLGTNLVPLAPMKCIEKIDDLSKIF
ncbi:MAG: hypothetical protein EON49_04765 [Acidovorax sp.]|nr:MAG: hypothetical protein EON49_04765 [Acidovorax sp.]